MLIGERAELGRLPKRRLSIGGAPSCLGLPRVDLGILHADF